MMLNDTIIKFLNTFLTESLNATTLHIGLAYNDKYNSSWKINKRYIQDYLISYVADGSADYYLDDTLYHVEKGSFIFITNDTHHYANNASDNFHAMGFRFMMFNDAGQAITFTNQCSFIDKLIDPSPVIHNIKTILNYYTSDNPIEKRICLNTVYSTLFSVYDQASYDTLFMSVKEYVDHHITTKIDHKDIAKHTNLSKNYLNKVFKEKYNMTLKHYIFKRKMEQAKSMLLETDLKVSEIADYLSYSDQYIFSNMFKKYWDLSPRTCRNNDRLQHNTITKIN